MVEKKNTNLHHLGEEEEESDQDDTVSLSDYLTDDQQELESSSSARQCFNSDYSFEFPFNGNNANTGENDTAFGTAVNFFGYSFDDRLRYHCGGSSNEKSASNLILPVKSKSCRSPATESYRHRRSSDSRKHKVLFGLAKIPSKMELSDIKKRQSSRKPAPIIPVVHGETTVVSSGVGCGGGRRQRSVLVVPLKQCGVHLANVLAQAKASFGCVSRA
ncbi:hypothetical protein ACOSQ4_033097 [Xanthoceras sorbifolium]